MHRVHLTDGRVLPGNFGRFTHGYAVTAHRSQGKSVDSVIISADGMRRELFYVAASRGRESLVVITSDKESLRESVTQSNARQSASELSRRTQPGLRPGLHRGFEAACRLVRHAALYMHRQWERLGLPLTELARQPELEVSTKHVSLGTRANMTAPNPATRSAPAKEATGGHEFDR
jgi:hypothetical protein